MRVWLVACVIAVLVAAGIAAAVVVLSGGEGEEAVEREAVSAVVEETEAGGHRGRRRRRRPQPSRCASTQWREPEVRDVDYRTWWPNGPSSPSGRRRAGIELRPVVRELHPARWRHGRALRLRPPAGIPGPDGVRRLLYGEPAGSYRLARGMPYVIDIPAGAVIVFLGLIEHEPEAGRTDAPDSTVGTQGRGDRLDTPHRPGNRQGGEARHQIARPDHGVDPRVDGVGAGGARAPVATPLDHPRYNLLDITGAATAPGSYAFLKTTRRARLTTSAIPLEEASNCASTRQTRAVPRGVLPHGAGRGDLRLPDAWRRRVPIPRTSASPTGIEKLAAYGGL